MSRPPSVTASASGRSRRPSQTSQTRVVVKPTPALAGVPAEALEYRLGNRSAIAWVIDQYQVCTDARSGIVSDPNREEDPQYIVRLVGQVVRASVQTLRIVEGLPGKFAQKN